MSAGEKIAAAPANGVADDVIINDDFRNWEAHKVGVFDLLLSDIPYGLGARAYASNPMWYKDRRVGGECSDLAAKPFFESDSGFDLDSYAEACAGLLKPSTGKRGSDGCVITFCSFEQQASLIGCMRGHGFKGYIPLTFVKRASSQALKANMRYCGATEHAILSYRDHLPRFTNHGSMILDWFSWPRTRERHQHPTQKPMELMERLIGIHTLPGMRVCDLTCGAGTTCVAAKKLGRHYVGFEIDQHYAQVARTRCSHQPVEPDLLELDAAERTSEVQGILAKNQKAIKEADDDAE
ncbi:site-specific DNA-methyltransferase [Bifidobacterium sp. ESL0745]|uniref:DNA-methyltransferase n=1 Tax=Bifidobacterium sp. ESL0745 TaxID=2983226 RepID=UPI0023F82C36|nr:site-specific DNA-methyltransferase [Bifidobacterium sp. ESL0745]MDF7665704.1 site-specific DNA-methyltransferase [Bifidobacterium sp. ESL0745]